MMDEELDINSSDRLLEVDLASATRMAIASAPGTRRRKQRNTKVAKRCCSRLTAW